MTDPPSFAPSAGGSFVWTASLAEAQAMARASGKLIFVEEGRPACSSCMTLKNRIIPTPEISADLGSVAVGYYDDVDANPNSQSFQILRTNLPNAVMLPLCGFLTPDLRWVHGWSGGRDAPRLRAEIASARARARAFALATPPAGPAPRLASASRTPTATTAAAPARPAAAPEDPERAWARDRLGRAVDALACLDYAKARAILAEVRPRAAGLPEEKEALQGEAAIERLDRIERAETASEASRLRDDAREALAGTCWEPLFPQ